MCSETTDQRNNQKKKDIEIEGLIGERLCKEFVDLLRLVTRF